MGKKQAAAEAAARAVADARANVDAASAAVTAAQSVVTAKSDELDVAKGKAAAARRALDAARAGVGARRARLLPPKTSWLRTLPTLPLHSVRLMRLRRRSRGLVPFRLTRRLQ